MAALLDTSGVDRYLAVDDDGRGLRATWRPAHGFVNVSLWRGKQCVETFHLTPGDAAGLVAFLVGAFAAAVPPPAAHGLRSVPSPPAVQMTPAPSRSALAVQALRTRAAQILENAARSLRT